MNPHAASLAPRNSDHGEEIRHWPFKTTLGYRYRALFIVRDQVVYSTNVRGTGQQTVPNEEYHSCQAPTEVPLAALPLFDICTNRSSRPQQLLGQRPCHTRRVIKHSAKLHNPRRKLKRPVLQIVFHSSPPFGRVKGEINVTIRPHFTLPSSLFTLRCVGLDGSVCSLAESRIV